MLEALNALVLQSFALPPNTASSLLDAGCGTGATLRYFAERLPKSSLQGIGLAPGLIALGNKIHEKQSAYRNIQLHTGDFHKMPFSSGTFDAVVAIESVCYGKGSDKAALVKEFSRVIKKGGKLVVVDVFQKTNKKLSKPFQVILHAVQNAWSIEAMGNLPGFMESLSACGFEVRSLRNITLNAVPSAAHIPFVVLKLLLSAMFNDDNKKGKLAYAKALGITLLLVLLTPFLGYYLLVAEKRGD